MTNTYDSLNYVGSLEEIKSEYLNFIEGKNGPTTFLPLNTNIGGQSKPNKNKEMRHLTEDQAKHIYKKVESRNVINIGTVKQETDQDWELNRLDDTSGDINPYKELIVNNAKKVDTILSQMEQWSIFSNVVNYIQYNRHPKNFYNLYIKVIHQVNHKRRPNTREERQMLKS